MGKAIEKPSMAERIRQCILDNGGYESVSVKTGIPVRTLANYASGDSEPKASALVAIAGIANVTLEWLATGKENTNWILPLEDKNRDLTFVREQGHILRLPVLKAEASVKKIVFETYTADFANIDTATLNFQYGVDSKDLFALSMSGESMEPTIKAGEYLIVSQSAQHKQFADGVYLIRMDGHILVKRFQVLPDSRIKILSDNSAYQAFELDRTQKPSFDILGRVIMASSLRRF